MTIKDFTKVFTDIDNEFKTTTDAAEKAELTKKFWSEAVRVFNEELAGDYTNICGETVNVPKIIQL